MYREDSARGGVQMLPVIEPNGQSTARRIEASAVLLMAMGLLPRWIGLAGRIYLMVAVAAGSVALLWEPAWRASARRPGARGCCLPPFCICQFCWP